MEYLEVRDSKSNLVAIIRGHVELAWDNVNGTVLRAFHGSEDPGHFTSVWFPFETHFEVR